ncbi:hypothetical protein [Arenimonas sp.]|uniref:hypothetical protein n=1 Tax=Arenimonas sp. TaxID=1872635 RepID=UPI0035AFAA45
MTLSTWLLAMAAGLFLLGLWPWLRRAPARPRTRRRGWPGRTLGALAIVLALALAGLGGLLRGYHWLLADVPVGNIALRELGTQRYEATLYLDRQPPRVFELRGDEWQLDARVIRWTLPGRLAGLPPVYRFERLSGRYGDPKQELESPRTVHDLRTGWDFWEFRQRWLSRWPVADARWGSAAYLPMLDGAIYDLSLNPAGGLVAKPADARTEDLLRQAGW